MGGAAGAAWETRASVRLGLQSPGRGGGARQRPDRDAQQDADTGQRAGRRRRRGVGPLLLAAALAFLGASAAASLLDVQEAHGRPKGQWSDLGEVARAIRSRPYLLRVGTMVLLATVTFTLVDFVFKSVADDLVPADDLGAFFASTYLAINILSLAVQLILVRWLLGHFGLMTAVVFVPAGSSSASGSQSSSQASNA